MTPFIVTIKNRDLALITQYAISAKDELAALYKLPSVLNFKRLATDTICTFSASYEEARTHIYTMGYVVTVKVASSLDELI